MTNNEEEGGQSENKSNANQLNTNYFPISPPNLTNQKTPQDVLTQDEAIIEDIKVFISLASSSQDITFQDTYRFYGEPVDFPIADYLPDIDDDNNNNENLPLFHKL